MAIIIYITSSGKKAKIHQSSSIDYSIICANSIAHSTVSSLIAHSLVSVNANNENIKSRKKRQNNDRRQQGRNFF